MTDHFGTIEVGVALVGALTAGTGFALRVLSAPRLRPETRWLERLRPTIPVLLGLVVVLGLGAVFGRNGSGPKFEEAVLLGVGAAAAVFLLEDPVPASLPVNEDQPLPLTGAVAGVTASGTALLVVLAALLAFGVGVPGLFGVAVGSGLLLLFGEPQRRADLRVRYASVVATLAVGTALVPNTILLRAVVPDALLLPLLFGALATVAGAIGTVLDRVEGPYVVGVPIAAIFGTLLVAGPLSAWTPDDDVLLLAVAAGWLAVAVGTYGSRSAAFARRTASETVRAGIALGVIGSISRGLRTVALVIVGVAGAALIAHAAARSIVPESAFGVVLAAVTATTAAASLTGVRAPAGPLGKPCTVPEELDVTSVAWAGLAVGLSLPFVVAFGSGTTGFVPSNVLALGNPAALAGLLLGAVLPFLAGSAGAGRARRTVALVSPALVVSISAVLLGPAAVVGFVLGSAVSGVALGTLWVSARAAAASLDQAPELGGRDRDQLAAALDAGTGWRVAAAGVAACLAALAVVAVGIPGTGVFGF